MKSYRCSTRFAVRKSSVFGSVFRWSKSTRFASCLAQRTLKVMGFQQPHGPPFRWPKGGWVATHLRRIPSGGTLIRVSEVVFLEREQRVRARLRRPEGWITLRNTETGRSGGLGMPITGPLWFFRSRGMGWWMQPQEVYMTIAIIWMFVLYL